MNSQQEYEQFMTKFWKAARDVQEDFNRLSPENKQRVENEADAFLKQFSHAVTLRDIMSQRNW